jgi:hypothetical protein
MPGDEVYLFGFSRGAYTICSLAGLIDRKRLTNYRFTTSASTRECLKNSGSHAFPLQLPGAATNQSAVC